MHGEADLGPLTLAIEVSNPTAWPPTTASAAPLIPSAALRPGVVVGRVIQGAGAVEVLAAAPTGLGPGASDDLVMAIDIAMRAAGQRARDLQRIAVSLGPGGFTGLRVAVTITKMLCAVTGAACVGVPSALVAAHALRLRTATGPAGSNTPAAPNTPPESGAPPATCAVALASKGATAIIECFRAGRTLGPGTEMDETALRALLAREQTDVLFADRFLPEPMRHAAQAHAVRIEPLVLDPRACLLASETLPPVDPEALLPIYAREPEAVRKWRALGR